MAFILIPIFITVAIFQIPTLIKKKYWRELIVFSSLSIIALSPSLLYVSGVQLPSPIPLMKYVIEDILHLKY
ncbi:MAG TPA: hypothetical protein DDW50_17020 [Firmicutes bacterium]|nr:hypothetical protein [Bacillota bacterium]